MRQGDEIGIVTHCPSCGNQTLFVGSRGHLVCSWLSCREPSVEHAIAAIKAERDRLDALVNSPQIRDFTEAVATEAAHQLERWPAAHDENKSGVDWYWLIGYLGGKALHTPIGKDVALSAIEIAQKRLHRIIAIAAACANWHRLELGTLAKAEQDHEEAMSR